jgi:hypothetical protein
MIKLRPYFIISITLLLVAGPWLKTAEVNASFEQTTGCGCCQGHCKGCCCSKPTAPEKTKPANEKAACTCELSDLPAIPALSFEFNEHRLNEKSIKVEIESPQVAQLRDSLNLYDLAADKSPPLIFCRPAYVLFSTLLI